MQLFCFVLLRWDAFASCLAECLPRFIDVATPSGPRPGFFPSLTTSLGAGSYDAGSAVWHRAFLRTGLESAGALEESWDFMQALLPAGSTGPLTSAVGDAGRAVPRRLQRLVTRQREDARCDALDDALMALPPDDQRRVAHVQSGVLSAQWVTSRPTEHDELQPDEFAELISLHFGLPSPAVRRLGLAGRSFRDTFGHWQVVDEHGSALARAICPDGEHQRQARETERLLTRLVLEGGVRGRTQARGIFSHVLPQDVLADERCGIIPDAVFALPQPFPRAASTVAARRAALREFLIEIKNIHDGVAQYTHARSVSFRCGGAVRRASEVDREYHVSAMHLDHTHHGVQLQTVQRRLAPVGGPGPVEA